MFFINSQFYYLQEEEESDDGTEVFQEESDDSETEDIDEANFIVPPGNCMNVIFQEDDGTEVLCNNACNPNEQLCKDCRMFGHQITGLL